MEYKYIPCNLIGVSNLKTEIQQFDALCIVDNNEPEELSSHFQLFRSKDKAFNSEVTCLTVPGFDCLIVYAPVGQLNDYDDVRAYERAAQKAINRALKAGAKTPLLVLPKNSSSDRYKNTALCSILGAFHELYVPIQLREDVPEKKQCIQSLGIYFPENIVLKKLIDTALLYECGRFVTRDIGVGDPERMAPPKVVEYIDELFGNHKSIKVTVINDRDVLRNKYPLFEAVNRGAASVQRHCGSIVFLEYIPPNAVKKSLLLVGKGVTYDTGGADIKAGGVMAGMSRDKCGAATVAGFMKIVSEIKPKDVLVVGVLCMVRNSVGEECYVSDEVITSRAGKRIRVGNTDAEGRMAMADALCEMKERAKILPEPHLFTVATLTGHACLAVGEGYTIVVDNGPARNDGHGLKIKEIGEQIGNPFEISTLQREDFDFHRGVCLGEDIVQSNNLPSSRTPRGHQTPAAFLMMATGLDEHGTAATIPLKYSHLDIAGSAGEYPYKPTAAPLLALVETHLM